MLWSASATEFKGWEDYSELIKMVVAISFSIIIVVIFHKKTVEMGLTVSLVILFLFNELDWFSFMTGKFPGGKTTIGVIIAFFGLLAFISWLKKASREE